MTARRLRILVTAGPTREMLDPVRFISNLSTGEMGYAVARAACQAGHDVTLVSGPTGLTPPAGVKFHAIVSARDLQKTCRRIFPAQDALVMTAAVADFTAARASRQKIRRTRTHHLLLSQTPDIVAGLAARKGKRRVIGFCLETQDWLKNAAAKLKRKRLDGIVANFYNRRHVPFGKRKITTAFLGQDGKPRLLRNQSKKAVASALVRWLERL